MILFQMWDFYLQMIEIVVLFLLFHQRMIRTSSTAYFKLLPKL